MADGVQKEFRFALFGDSICFGQGVAAHRTWATRLAASIEASLSPTMRAVVFNPSINGDTTRKALERMAFDIQSRGINGILIQFGLNDANHWISDRGLPRVSEAAFAANLQEMVARARAFGAHPVMLNTNHPTTRTITNMDGATKTYEASNQRYNAIIREVAARDGSLILNDIDAHARSLVGPGNEKLAGLLQEDGLHLSERGHDMYFEFLSPLVASAIRASA